MRRLLSTLLLALLFCGQALAQEIRDTLQAAIKTDSRRLEQGLGRLLTGQEGIRGVVSPMGEGDLIRWAQSLPGVTTGADGSPYTVDRKLSIAQPTALPGGGSSAGDAGQGTGGATQQPAGSVQGGWATSPIPWFPKPGTKSETPFLTNMRKYWPKKRLKQMLNLPNSPNPQWQ